MRRALSPLWILAAAVLGFAGPALAEAPRVVISVQPIHALVSGLMDRVAIPDLLVRRDASPHDYRLRASQKRKLAEADLVVWVGDGLDDFMAEAIAELPPATRVIKITDLDLPVRLPLRTSDLWRKDGPAAGERTDPHVWLDTDNAAVIVAALSRALIGLDRAHKIDYGRNDETIRARLGGLHRQLRRALNPYRGIPIIVQHDAFQYLEQRYGLEVIGAVMTGSGSGDAPPPAHVEELVDEATALDAGCLMAQPQFNRGGADAFAAEAGLRVVDMDPLHADQRGISVYFEMMRALPKAIAACLP